MRQGALALFGTVAGCSMPSTGCAHEPRKAEREGRKDSMAEKGSTRVNKTPPQRGQSLLCPWKGGLAQLQRTALVLWDNERWIEKQRVPLEQPIGIGRLSDGGLMAIERPAALAGNVRLHTLAADATPQKAAQGFVSYSLVAASFVGAGRTADEFVFAGQAKKYHLTLQKVYGPEDLRGQDIIPLEADDAQTLVSIGPGVAACLHGREILKLSFPAAKASYPLPASVQNPVHLSYSGKGESFWVSTEKALHLVTLGQPVQIQKTVPVGPGLIFHIDSAEGQVAVLLLEELAGATVRKWTLVLYQDGTERWRAAVPDGPPQDRFVALVPGSVVVSEGEGLLVWESTSGSRRK